MTLLLHLIAWIVFLGFPIAWIDTNLQQWKAYCNSPLRIVWWTILNLAELWAFFYLWELKP